MNHREALIEAASALILEKEQRLEDITVREICRRAGVGLGLINYHFGSKERLIEICVERRIKGIVEAFKEKREGNSDLPPMEKLEMLGNMTLDFLMEHEAISRISILADMEAPRQDDNSHRTYRAFVPLVAACRPDWDQDKVGRRTFCLISLMQQSFLRRHVLLTVSGVDLADREQRRKFHHRALMELMRDKREDADAC